MNYALPAALKESASTRRGKAEAKELPFVSTFLFSWVAEGVLLRLRLVTASRPTYGLLAVANAVKLNFATRRRGGNDGGEGAD